MKIKCKGCGFETNAADVESAKCQHNAFNESFGLPCSWFPVVKDEPKPKPLDSANPADNTTLNNFLFF